MAFRFKLFCFLFLSLFALNLSALEQSTIDELKNDVANHHYQPFIQLLDKYSIEQPSVAVQLAEQIIIDDVNDLAYIQFRTLYALALYRYGNFKNLNNLIQTNLSHALIKVDARIYQTNIILLAKLYSADSHFIKADKLLLEYITKTAPSSSSSNNTLPAVNTLAESFITQGYNEKALAIIFSSFSQINLTNIEQDTLNKQQVKLIINTANILIDTANLQAALALLKSIEAHSHLDDPEIYASWLLSYATCKSKIGYFNDAISAIESFRTIVGRVNDLPYLAILMEQAAQLSIYLELTDSAKRWAERAKNLFLTIDSKTGLLINQITFFELTHLTGQQIKSEALTKLKLLISSHSLYRLPKLSKRLQQINTVISTKLNLEKPLEFSNTQLKLNQPTDENAIFNYQVKNIELFLAEKELSMAKNAQILLSYQLKYTYIAFAIFIVLILYLSNSRIKNNRKIVCLQNRIINLEKKLETSNEVNNHDSLTGLYSHRYITKFLRQASNETQVKFIPYTVILLSLDKFQDLVDDNGFACGDTILKNVAHILIKENKNNYTLGRWGNEEFIICLPNTRIEKSKKLAEQIRVLVDQSTMAYNDTFHNVTISLGIASAHPKETFDQLLARADHALLQASRKGNRINVHRDH
ncbi:GGDEF domain-containing protein [Algibacillus agarilyticus]|uniref:GGDEF domain-containing protein n=1 Tax=Algibacillus agarilyticus TaxID=2234133 RepID=UPI0013007156|nr:GGDEF domain-containing protein [Algibacillus agarilyticus]